MRTFKRIAGRVYNKALKKDGPIVKGDIVKVNDISELGAIFNPAVWQEIISEEETEQLDEPIVDNVEVKVESKEEVVDNVEKTETEVEEIVEKAEAEEKAEIEKVEPKKPEVEAVPQKRRRNKAKVKAETEKKKEDALNMTAIPTPDGSEKFVDEKTGKEYKKEGDTFVEAEKSAPSELVIVKAGPNVFDVMNSKTNKPINDKPLSLEEAKALKVGNGN